MNELERLGREFFPHIHPALRQALMLKLLVIYRRFDLFAEAVFPDRIVLKATCQAASSAHYQYSR